jgi:hypothetical protein
MPYYTLHMNMFAHPYAYHRNTRIQHRVREDVHSEDPVKNRVLTLGYIFIEETIIFIAM